MSEIPKNPSAKGAGTGVGAVAGAATAAVPASPLPAGAKPVAADQIAPPSRLDQLRNSLHEDLHGLRQTTSHYADVLSNLFSTQDQAARDLIAQAQYERERFTADIELADRYQGPPGFLQEIREFALDSPAKALGRIQEQTSQLPSLTDAQLAQILSALDVTHAQLIPVNSDALLAATTAVLTAHLSPPDQAEVRRWLTQSAKAKTEAEVGYPNLSPKAQGQVRAITTRMSNTGHTLAGRFSPADKIRFDHLQARRLQPGDWKGALDYIWALTHTHSSPGTQAELLDDPGLEMILDPAVQGQRDQLFKRMRAWDPAHLDDAEVQNIAEQLRGVPLDKDGRPPRVGIRDQKTGKVYPLVDFNGPGCKPLSLPPGLLTQNPNGAYPHFFHDIAVAMEEAKAAQAQAAKEGRTLSPNERPPLWLHDFAFQSDGTGWAVAAWMVAAHDAGVDVRLQYDPEGSKNSNIAIGTDGKVTQLLTDPAIRKYLTDHGVVVLPFPTGKGSISDATAKDYLSHLKKDLVGKAAYLGGAGNKGDQYSVKNMFHDALTRLTGPGTGDTADGLAQYWNYSVVETLRREHIENPNLKDANAFNAYIVKKYGGPLEPITPERIAAYRATLKPVPGAPTDPYLSITQVDHWGGHRDENGKEALSAMAEVASNTFGISMPYPTDPFFARAVVNAEADLKKMQDEQHVPASARKHAVVVVPAFNDVSYEYWGMLRKYKAILTAQPDAEIYEFSEDAMLHNKFMVADDFWEHGSHNGDWRSRFGNNENICFQWNGPQAAKFRARLEYLKKHAVRLTLAIVNARLANFGDRYKADEANLLDEVIKL